MLREIREAGYDPRAATAFTPIANQTATALTLQNDWDGDGAIAGVNAVTPPWGGAQGERVVYSLSGSTLRRQETGIDGAALPVAEGVQSLAFQYLDAAGAVTSVAADIRTVVVSITTRPVDQPASGAAGHIQVTMTDRVRLRNRGT
jgi:hypothetical protein